MDELRIKIMAAMETGNTGSAKLLFRDAMNSGYTELLHSIRTDVAASYDFELIY